MPEPTYFTDCHCPACEAPLHQVTTKTTTCPQCNAPLVPEQVWHTRRYAGVITFPGWVKAFGWPFLLMIAGLAFGIAKVMNDWPIPLFLPAIPFSVGAAYFMAKIMTNGQDT
jgi:hypothetical protein